VTGYRYDDRVVALVRSGVATIDALRRECNIPGGTMKIIMRRLLKTGQIRMVTKGWYA
jgi:hypothetical protein